MSSKTLADTLAANETLRVNSGHPACCRSTRLDVQALIDRLGPDHGAMHWDLVNLFYCFSLRDRGPSAPPGVLHLRSRL